MQVTETLNEGLKRGYRITLTAAELDARVEEKLKEAQPQVELKGFRKGGCRWHSCVGNSASRCWAR
jgi:trigger factor